MTNYDRIRVLWPDHLGLPRGKYLPIHVAHHGTYHCATTFALGYDRSMIPAPGSFLLQGLKDVLSTYDPGQVHPGWEDDRTGVAVGHLGDGGRAVPAGRLATRCSRPIAVWRRARLQGQVGLELEAYVIESDGDGGGALEHAAVVRLRDGSVRRPDRTDRQIMRRRRRASSASSRSTPSSTWASSSSRSSTTRRCERPTTPSSSRSWRPSTALEHGLDLTFMGKPFAGVSGNGVHVNFSLIDREGNNAFAADPATDDGLSVLAKRCLAGLSARTIRR